MNKAKALLLGLFIVSMALGCKNRKGKGDCAQALIKLPTNSTELVQENLVDFQDVTLRVKANYNDGNNDQSFGMLMKMKKDSFVWVSVQVIIEVARAYITPDSFKLVDRINKKYYLGSIESLERFVGQKLTLAQLQNLLLANPVFAIEGFQKMNDELRNDYLQQNSSGVINKMQLTQCFRPNESEFSTALNPNKVVVDYKNFTKEKDLGMVPNILTLSAKDSARNFDFLMEYTSISTEEIAPIIFKIPSKYEQGK